MELLLLSSPVRPLTHHPSPQREGPLFLEVAMSFGEWWDTSWNPVVGGEGLVQAVGLTRWFGPYLGQWKMATETRASGNSARSFLSP